MARSRQQARKSKTKKLAQNAQGNNTDESNTANSVEGLECPANSATGSIDSSADGEVKSKEPWKKPADGRIKKKKWKKKPIPENAATMHPVQLLHQLRPGVKYETVQSPNENQNFFHISADIDDQTFRAKGPNMKQAKFRLALEAIKALFNVESQYGHME